MATTILIKRDTSTNWYTNNPILKSGEFGLETDTRKIKIGNGQRWNSILKFIQPTENTAEALLVNYILNSEKGQANGVATLDSYGKIPLNQFPDALSLDSELSAAAATAATDATTKANAAQAAAISAAATDATTKANAAQAAAISAAATDATTKVEAEADLRVLGDAASVLAAATDATTKANLAETTAKAYTDEIAIDLLNNLGNSLGDYIPLNKFGTPSGVATLDSNGILNLTQIPSLVATITNLETSKSEAIASAGTAADTKISTAVAALTKSSVGLANVDNTADASKPVSTAQASAIATAKSEAIADATSQVNALLTGAPAALNTLDELAAALGDDANFAGTVTTSLAAKAPLNSPTFTGTVNGITKSMVGLSNVDNTTDANKPVSSATQTALDTKLNKIIETNPQPGSYSIISSDAFKLIEMSGGGTLTIVDSVNFPTGTTIEVLQTTDSQVLIAGSGFTPNSTPGLKLRAKWSSATLLKRGTNSWVVMGDLSA